jgi:hypothetical protein
VFFAAEILIIINTIKTKQMKKLYEKPSMRVFDLKQKPSLLAGSGGGTDNYTPDNTPYNW